MGNETGEKRFVVLPWFAKRTETLDASLDAEA
jgi:hypothetical protein